jgi:hypothetical protein
MKKVLLAAGLGLGVLTFTMAGATSHATAPTSHLIKDTVPTDTTQQPTPTPDTSSVNQ